MFLIEVFVPAGTSTARQRAVADGLGAALVGTDHAAPETVQSAQDLTDVLVHEVPAWWVGGRQAHEGAPRYLVRVSVPGPWRKEMSEHAVTRVTAALADLEDDPDRVYRDPVVRVHVVGVPEGGHGLYGQVYSSNAIGELLSQPFREARRNGTAKEAPPGMYIDPSCGAVMPKDAAEAVLAEVDGVTHGFCCSGCRDAYLAEVAG